MMPFTRSLAGALGVVAIALMSPNSLAAQRVSGILFGVGPVGMQGMGVGVHAQAAYLAPLPMGKLGARLEGSFSGWSRNGESAAHTTQRVSSLGLAIERSFGDGRLQPFALVGAGTYVRPGHNLVAGGSAGVGLRYGIGSMSIHSEVRYHEIAGAGRGPLPFILGIQFR